MRLSRHKRLAIVMVMIVATFASASCSDRSTNNATDNFIGDYSYDAPIIAMVYEDLDDEGSGILYREVLDFDKLLEKTDKPILIYMYSSMHPDDTGTTASIEQMAEDYHYVILVISVDLFQASDVADRYEVAAVPEFIIIDSGDEISRFDSVNKQVWYPGEVLDWMVSVIETIK